METDGWRFVGPACGLAIVCLVVGCWVGNRTLLSVGFVFVVLAGFFTYFFRDPERQPPEGKGWIVSPADGKVLSVETDMDGRSRIAIFLSVFDVHINRAPIAGIVESIDYRPGRFFKAFDPRASKENEQAVVVIDSEYGKIEFALIAGILARRVVCRIDVGQRLKTGERVGLIRFGSRAEVVVPAGVPVLVQPGEHVQGGATPLARFAVEG
ncbi:MAG: phosphatidylserine decarboxylase [Gammaproteobacteria bacterium]|nr:phosphatidylserine decarboxylase [Gammaproteobacteria bacterium]